MQHFVDNWRGDLWSFLTHRLSLQAEPLLFALGTLAAARRVLSATTGALQAQTGSSFRLCAIFSNSASRSIFYPLIVIRIHQSKPCSVAWVIFSRLPKLPYTVWAICTPSWAGSPAATSASSARLLARNRGTATLNSKAETNSPSLSRRVNSATSEASSDGIASVPRGMPFQDQAFNGQADVHGSTQNRLIDRALQLAQLTRAAATTNDMPTQWSAWAAMKAAFRAMLWMLPPVRLSSAPGGRNPAIAVGVSAGKTFWPRFLALPDRGRGNWR